MHTYSHKLSLLWAKKARGGELAWLPLPVHLADSAQVARFLWREWVPQGTRSAIARDLNTSISLSWEDLEAYAGDVLCFLCAAHDLGKATPSFQVKPTAFMPGQLDDELLQRQRLGGVPMPAEDDHAHLLEHSNTPHGLTGQHILLEMGCDRSIAAVLGAHHGRPATPQELGNSDRVSCPANYHLNDAGKPVWQGLQHAVVEMALGMSGIPDLQHLPRLGMVAQMLYLGLVIMVDWIASNEGYFPYIGLFQPPEDLNLEDRMEQAMAALHLPPYWQADLVPQADELYQARFSFSPRPMQSFVADIAQHVTQPGIMVVEAAMGRGKTEAALVAAEVFAHKSGRSGVFFALPTQATSNGIYPRIQQWASHFSLEEAHSIRLAHGKAQFNETYHALFEGSDNIDQENMQEGLQVHPWFEGNKKALLADFVVGTVDQALLMALKQKHVMLRHLGLAGKVVIIDECHAYDAYMNQYLERALNWLAAYGVPVIVLSATLPGEKRLSLVQAYLSGLRLPEYPVQVPEWAHSRGYPLVTWTDGEQTHSRSLALEEKQLQVQLKNAAWEDVPRLLEDALAEGGCAGIVLNTVQRAQDMARLLRETLAFEVRLLHARFLAPHRAALEAKLQKALGKPGPDTERPYRLVVVGTQVLEQSLDIDFDLLITDLCPMDLLLQRMGRMHRHNRGRSPLNTVPRCFIIDKEKETFDSGTQAIYGEYYLLRAQALLKDSLTLPRDIPLLVQEAYDDTQLPLENQERLLAAKTAHDEKVHKKKRGADAWRLVAYQPGARKQRIDNLLNVTNRVDEEAAVRDGEESIEVLLLQQRSDGQLHLVAQDASDGACQLFSANEVPDKHTARLLARQSLRLSGPLCSAYRIQETLKQLEDTTLTLLPKWQQSPWLKGSLFLVLNQAGLASLNGFTLRYDAIRWLLRTDLP